MLCISLLLSVRLQGHSCQRQGGEGRTIYTDVTANVSPSNMANSCVFVSRSDHHPPIHVGDAAPHIPAACCRNTSMWMVLLQTFGPGERGS